MPTALDTHSSARSRPRAKYRCLHAALATICLAAPQVQAQSSTPSIVVIGGRPGNPTQVRQAREELASLLKLRECIPADFAAGRWAPTGMDGAEAACESSARVTSRSVDALLYHQSGPPPTGRARAHLAAIDARIEQLQRELGLPTRPRQAPADEDDNEEPLTARQCSRFIEFRDHRLVSAYDRAADRFRINRGVIDDLSEEEKVLTNGMPSTSDWAALRDAAVWNLETTARLIKEAGGLYEARGTSSIAGESVTASKLILKTLKDAKSLDDADRRLTAQREAELAAKTRPAADNLESAITKALKSLMNVDRLEQVTHDREALRSTVATSLAGVRSALTRYSSAVDDASADITGINSAREELDHTLRDQCRAPRR
jgi:hypothetical protein